MTLFLLGIIVQYWWYPDIEMILPKYLYHDQIANHNFHSEIKTVLYFRNLVLDKQIYSTVAPLIISPDESRDILVLAPSCCRRRRTFLVYALQGKRIKIFFSNLLHMLSLARGRPLLIGDLKLKIIKEL